MDYHYNYGNRSMDIVITKKTTFRELFKILANNLQKGK